MNLMQKIALAAWFIMFFSMLSVELSTPSYDSRPRTINIALLIGLPTFITALVMVIFYSRERSFKDAQRDLPNKTEPVFRELQMSQGGHTETRKSSSGFDNLVYTNKQNGLDFEIEGIEVLTGSGKHHHMKLRYRISFDFALPFKNICLTPSFQMSVLGLTAYQDDDPRWLNLKKKGEIMGAAYMIKSDQQKQAKALCERNKETLAEMYKISGGTGMAFENGKFSFAVDKEAIPRAVELMASIVKNGA